MKRTPASAPAGGAARGTGPPRGIMRADTSALFRELATSLSLPICLRRRIQGKCVRARARAFLRFLSSHFSQRRKPHARVGGGGVSLSLSTHTHTHTHTRHTHETPQRVCFAGAVGAASQLAVLRTSFRGGRAAPPSPVVCLSDTLHALRLYFYANDFRCFLARCNRVALVERDQRWEQRSSRRARPVFGKRRVRSAPRYFATCCGGLSFRGVYFRKRTRRTLSRRCHVLFGPIRLANHRSLSLSLSLSSLQNGSCIFNGSLALLLDRFLEAPSALHFKARHLTPVFWALARLSAWVRDCFSNTRMEQGETQTLEF